MRGLDVVSSALAAAALFATVVVGQSNSVDPVIIKVRFGKDRMDCATGADSHIGSTFLL